LFDAQQQIQLVDLGTGSGAIAIAIAKARPNWQVLATDRYAPTLAIAQHNAARYQLNNIHFLQSNWFDQIAATQRFDIILSNPPYIPELDPHLQQGDVRFEPAHALRSGKDGLDDIRHLIHTSRKYLQPSGWLLLEHGYDQGETVKTLFAQAGHQHIEQRRDLGGHIRISYGNIAAQPSV
jgi:release factor glutamine methyltransferase